MFARLCFIKDVSILSRLFYRLNAPLNAAVPEGGARGGFDRGGPDGGAACLGGPVVCVAVTGLTLLATSAMLGICVSIRACHTF